MAELETVTREIELKPGAVFPFGAEKVWWRVLELDRETGTMLVVSEKEVCQRVYHSEWRTYVTWEDCDLRKWLNEEYLKKTFNAQEQEAILERTIQTPDNVKYKTKGGNDTQDKLFLLSLDEVQQYFKDNEDRATDSWWWLRSPGDDQDRAAYVNYDGAVDGLGRYVYFGYGIRPAFCINLNADFFQSILSPSSESFTITVSQQCVMTEVEVKPGAWFPMGKHGAMWRILAVNKIRNTALATADETIGVRAYHAGEEPQPGKTVRFANG